MITDKEAPAMLNKTMHFLPAAVETGNASVSAVAGIARKSETRQRPINLIDMKAEKEDAPRSV